MAVAYMQTRPDWIADTAWKQKCCSTGVWGAVVAGEVAGELTNLACSSEKHQLAQAVSELTCATDQHLQADALKATTARLQKMSIMSPAASEQQPRLSAAL
jgi:hypothetical protein